MCYVQRRGTAQHLLPPHTDKHCHRSSLTYIQNNTTTLLYGCTMMMLQTLPNIICIYMSYLCEVKGLVFGLAGLLNRVSYV